MDIGDVGIGDGPEKVTAFKVDRSLVMGYLYDAHEAPTRRMSSISAKRFDQLSSSWRQKTSLERPWCESQVIQHSTLGKIPIW